MKLEVGKRYKLADGVLRECTRMMRAKMGD
jgi:hypothetical protein